MKFGLDRKTWSVLIGEIKKNLGTTKNPKLFLYGSRAKGSAREFSDIDLLLKADRFDLASLRKVDFQDLEIPYKVDFVLDSDLFEAYRQEIYSHMKPIELG